MNGVAVVLAASLTLSSAPALPAKREGGDIALVGGEVHTVSGGKLPRATIVIRGGKIIAVGSDIPVPTGARTLDCAGKVVTPGLVEASTAIGLVEVAAEPSTVDNAPFSPDPVRAAVSASEGIDQRSMLVAVARRHGITSAVSVPVGGLISGRSAWLDLVSPESRTFADAVQPNVAMHVNLGFAGAQAVGGSRVTSVARLHEVLEDARVFKRDRALFQRNGLYRLSSSRLDLAALEPAISGSQRVVVSAHRAADILAALDLAKKERLKIAIVGGEEGWLVTGALAEAKVPVIVEPLANLPESFETRNARSDNATLLAQAGVKVAISTRSSHNASNLRFVLGTAVRAGLPPDLALRAATLTPAEIYGVDALYGTIEPGKRADVVVWTGDPFEPSSYAETVIIRGEVQPTESRQNRLALRYMRRHGLLPRGE